jgi:imidazolonepropionase
MFEFGPKRRSLKPTISMPMAMSLACTHMKMSPTEAIAATTINGAWALRLAERKEASIPGKMLIWQFLT